MGLLVWRWPSPLAVLSSAPVGGGFRLAAWVLNIGVPLSYRRTDLDEHCDEIASSLGLDGQGVALFTAANVAEGQRRSVGDVTVDATVGISKPTWAADPDGHWTPWQPGTVNLVIQLASPLEAGAAANAVITATEAKTQAFLDAGVPGTGTASDAVVIAWPANPSEPEQRFAGPRSAIGSQIAQAVHASVAAGISAWMQTNIEQRTADEAAGR
ncbi:MAG: adenosylcobinamide amidohydrolase [Acidimicrobiales bacterium]